MANVILEKIIIIFLPPNIMCCFKPMYIGIIERLKTRYCVRILETLLNVLDIEEGYENMTACQSHPSRVCKGIIVVGKHNIIGVIILYDNICNLDVKYVYNNTARNFWVKAEILSPDI